VWCVSEISAAPMCWGLKVSAALVEDHRPSLMRVSRDTWEAVKSMSKTMPGDENVWRDGIGRWSLGVHAGDGLMESCTESWEECYHRDQATCSRYQW